jgi:hypothetical protein
MAEIYQNPWLLARVFDLLVSKPRVFMYIISMQELTPGVTRRIKDGEAYYTVVWSALKKADKYEINLKVPAVAGLYELYRMDEQKKLNLLAVTHAWYGGLRSQLREAVDLDKATDPLRRAQIENAELYYRYAPANSLPDILDVVWFLHTTYFPNDVRVEPSGRYPRIYLSEQSPDKLFWQQ